MPDGRTATCFQSIGEVSRAGLPMFLVQDSVLGLMVESTGLNRKLVPHGEVLKVVQIYEDANREKICQQLKRDIHPDIMMYLKCLTRQGEVVFLPYSTKGRFYYISTPEYHTLNHVYLISNLLRVTKLPVVVRIVTGPKPQIALPISNIVQLNEVQYETVILGCTMVGNKPVLLEINANSQFSFVTAKDKSSASKTSAFKRMHQVCVMEGERWRQQIRVAHHVISRANSLSSISRFSYAPSSCTSISKAKRIDLKPSLPPTALVQHVRYSYYDRFFSKRFWSFRKSKRAEYPNVHTGSFRLPVEMVKNYVKRKGSKGSESKESSQRRRLRKFRMEYPRIFHSSDDGYSTSCADVESIYNSIH
ncbi:hypothetical protein JTE90_013451 [Oedothorax gibbosus]|uniref:CABIT domain-containing protein n=1 Tax=Oedothorax gibbosus TaxID=931172 RepID=A0AAV6VKX5_9ARAC|nr:hypothetical protein JTE90_013451 [Oedothorax gibbosus]